MFVAAKAFPHGNKRYRLGSPVMREDFPTQEAWDQFVSLGYIEERLPPAPAAPEALAAPVAPTA